MGDQLPKNNISRPEEVIWHHAASFGDVEAKWQLAQLYRSQGRDSEAERLEAEIEVIEKHALKVKRENRKLLWIGLPCFLLALGLSAFFAKEGRHLNITFLAGAFAGAAVLIGSYCLFLYFARTGDQQS